MVRIVLETYFKLKKIELFSHVRLAISTLIFLAETSTVGWQKVTQESSQKPHSQLCCSKKGVEIRRCWKKKVVKELNPNAIRC